MTAEKTANEKTGREKGRGKGRARAKKVVLFGQDAVITLRENVPSATLVTVAFIGSYGHLSYLAGKYGPPGSQRWEQYATAGCVDLLVIIAANERQRDKRIGRERRGWASWPTVVLAFGILVTLLANVATADPVFFGYCVSAWPAVALLIAVSIFERRMSFREDPVRTAQRRSGSTAGSIAGSTPAGSIAPNSVPAGSTLAGSGTGIDSGPGDGSRPDGSGDGSTAEEDDLDVQAAALEVWTKDPNISGADLGRAVGITRQYGNRLKKRFEISVPGGEVTS